MKIARFEPWSLVDLMHRDLNHPVANSANSGWAPAIDILEDKTGYLVRADLPGVNPEDIEVSMESGILTISGVRHAETRAEETDVRRTERTTGRFSRRFTLPETVDAESIVAKTSNGVLEISIPKLPEVQPRRITVEAA